jgi:hypothetical protein
VVVHFGGTALLGQKCNDSIDFPVFDKAPQNRTFTFLPNQPDAAQVIDVMGQRGIRSAFSGVQQ